MTLVVGLGKTGLSAVRALLSLGAEVAVTDTRPDPPGLAELQRDFPTVPCYPGGFPAAIFTGAQRLLVSPGVPLQTLAVAAAAARGVPLWGDIELFARLVQAPVAAITGSNPNESRASSLLQVAQAPVAAITGSNGKSTVTTLLGLMAEQAGVRVAVGGNLGTPALDLLARPAVELYVLELSSFQLASTYSLNARVATVLNLSPDHLDWHPGLEAYRQAKQRIFRGDGWMVLNADDPAVVAMAEPGRRISRFTLAAPSPEEFGLRRRDGERWLARGGDCWLRTGELQLSGDHNLANALAALCLGHALGLAREPMLAALRTFTGLPHRTQLILEHKGVRWYDDSKGTNVGATLAAVNGLPGRLVLIAGGDGKGQDFTPLGAALAPKVHDLVLIGRAAPAIAAAADRRVAVHQADSMARAVAVAAQLAEPGDSVLLSPACASFDMFSNYQERGRVFAAEVRRQLG